MEKFIAGTALVISLAVGAAFLGIESGVGPVGPQGPKGEQGAPGRDGVNGKNGVNGKDAVSVGAVAVLSSPLEVNGVSTYMNRVAIRQASTSLCSIKSPAASTTITATTAFVSGGNTYANDYVLGWGAAPGATTTPIARLTLAAGTGGMAVGTTTSLVQSFGVGKDGVVPPNTFINFNVSTSSASATFAPTGSCTVEFRSL